MGTIYKGAFTKPLPAGAKIIVRKGERLAEWKDAKGKIQTAPLTAAGDRITVKSGTYTAKYRDGAGIVRRVATGCTDKTAAQSVLNDLETRAARVKGKILTPAEDGMIDHQDTLLADHVAAFFEHQDAKGVTDKQINETRSRLDRVAADCKFVRLSDLAGVQLERWLLARQKTDDMGATTRNAYREAWLTFTNWCVRTGRLVKNPFADVPKADAKADRRRQRRALTEAELVRLLDVARRRMVETRSTVFKGPRKGERYAKLRPEVQRRLERLGEERALIYKTLVLTGLRKGELASLTVGQLVLDAEPAYLVLNAANEKNREGSTIPLRSDLAADLRNWLASRLQAAQEASDKVAGRQCGPKARQRSKANQSGSAGPAAIPARLPADTPVFTVPQGLVKILNKDLAAAGISKRDERGRTVDVHALRHTFGTLLSKGGVTPRTAQAAMRHSTINLTMNTYTDPKLLDVAGAMDALPALPLCGGSQAPSAVAAPAGVNDVSPSQLRPNLRPAADNPCQAESTADLTQSGKDASSISVSACTVPFSAATNGDFQVPGGGIEPPASWLRARRHYQQQLPRIIWAIVSIEP